MFRFQHPAYLLFALLLPLLAYVFYQYRAWMLSVIQILGGQTGISRFFRGFDEKKLMPRFALLLTGLAFLVLGLANPQMQGEKQLNKQDGSPVVLVFDISESMLAQDPAPNRLERARSFFQQLLDELHGNPVGLVLFAGSGDLVAPVSNDYSYTHNALAYANPDHAAAPGTSLAAAFKLVNIALADKPGLAVLVTDGEDHEEGVLEVAEKLKENGVYLMSFGIGSTTGAPIPTKSGYKKDADGNTVHSKFNPEILETVNAITKGTTGQLTNNQEAIQLVLEKLSLLEKGEIETINTKAFQSYYQWLLFPAFLLFLLEWYIRKRKSSKTTSN